MSESGVSGACPQCHGDHPLDQRCPRASRTGQVVAEKYKITRQLGEGGMGAVYEARHEVIGRRFAIKFLHAELALHAQIFARFRREARAAGAIENENIAAVTDFGTTSDGAPYLVMEYLEGEDLARLLARIGPLPVPRAVYTVIQACRGLAAAHACGIVHRDLKPENLFVIRRGDGSDLVKVLDFGIAKLKSAENEEGASTRTGTTMGTAYYMPPEQARGQKDIDERADIYALGVILYELLSAQKPHVGETYNAVLYHILTKPAERLETLRSGLPAGLADAVHRAMAFAPADRFASVEELTSALAPFAGRTLTPSEPPRSLPRKAADVRTMATPVSELELPVPLAAEQVSVQPTVTAAAVSQGALAVRPRSKLPWLVALAVLGLGGALLAVSARGGPAAAPPAVGSQAPALAAALVHTVEPAQSAETTTALAATPSVTSVAVAPAAPAKMPPRRHAAPAKAAPTADNPYKP